MRHLIPISGKDSLATALLQTAHKPDLPYEFFFNDTGCELPEVYDWLDKVQSKTGWEIFRINGDLEYWIEKWGGFLPSGQKRYCTRKSKIEASKTYLQGDKSFIYYGLRADENRVGYVPFGDDSITPLYPLRPSDDSGMAGGILPGGVDLQGVYAILKAQDLLPPSFFWQKLFDAVKLRLSAMGIEGWEHVLSWLEIEVLFQGRTRANCYFCFFQKKIEWVWLYETHYDYFQRAKAFEKADYSWIQDYPLERLEDPLERQSIFDKKVKQICKVIINRLQGSLLEVEPDSAIAATSCGLICGK